MEYSTAAVCIASIAGICVIVALILNAQNKKRKQQIAAQQFTDRLEDMHKEKIADIVATRDYRMAEATKQLPGAMKIPQQIEGSANADSSRS